MRPFYFLPFLLLLACGEKHKRVEYGQTTETSLIEIKGEPLSEEIIPEPTGKLLSFEHDERYQVRGDKVVAAFKNPQGDEKILLYWKHKFKDCSSKIKKIKAPVDTHSPADLELSCPQQGLSVIYIEGSPFVSRINEYAKE